MGFGVRRADRESIQMMLGGLAMDIEIGRLLVMKAAWALDQSRFARQGRFVDGADEVHKMVLKRFLDQEQRGSDIGCCPRRGCPWRMISREPPMSTRPG